MKTRHLKRYQQTVRSLCLDIFDRSRKVSGPWSDLKATVTISQDTLRSERWNWNVHLHIRFLGGDGLVAHDYPNHWNNIRGTSDSGLEADSDARAIVAHARSVYAELVTTIAPPTTITIEV